MNQFEEEVRKALARQTPTSNFTAGVLAKCAGQPASGPSLNWWRAMALAATLLLMTGGAAYQQHEREQRGEAAKQKLMLALRIAGMKLQHAEERVRETTEVQQ